MRFKTADPIELELAFYGKEYPRMVVGPRQIFYNIMTATAIDYKQPIQNIIPATRDYSVGYNLSMRSMMKKEALELLAEMRTAAGAKKATLPGKWLTSDGKKTQDNEELTARENDISDIEEKIREGNQTLIPNVLNVICTAPDTATLIRKHEQILEELWPLGVTFVKPKNQRDVMTNILEGTVMPLEDANTMYLASEDMARILQRANQYAGGNMAGFPIGFTNYGKEVIFDPEGSISKIAAIFGQPGWGKSYLMGTLSKNFFTDGYRIEYLDPKGPAAESLSIPQLFENIGMIDSEELVHVVHYGEGKGVNVLDMFKDPKDQITYQKSIFRTMGFSETQTRIINETVEKMRNRRFRKPVINLLTVKETLQKRKAGDSETQEVLRKIIEIFENWTTEELLPILSADNPPDFEDADIVVHDLSLKDSEMKTKIMEMILLRVKIIMGKRDTLLVIDELHELLKNESKVIRDIVEFIGNQARAFRLYLLVAAQSRALLKKSTEGQTIDSNRSCAFYVGPMKDDTTIPPNYHEFLSGLKKSDVGQCIYEEQGEDGIVVQISTDLATHSMLTGSHEGLKAPVNPDYRLHPVLRRGDYDNQQVQSYIEEMDFEIFTAPDLYRQPTEFLIHHVPDAKSYILTFLIGETLDERLIENDVAYDLELVIIPHQGYAIYVPPTDVTLSAFEKKIRKLDLAIDWVVVADELPEGAPEFLKSRTGPKYWLKHHEIIDWINELEPDVARVGVVIAESVANAVSPGYSVYQAQHFMEENSP